MDGGRITDGVTLLTGLHAHSQLDLYAWERQPQCCYLTFSIANTNDLLILFQSCKKGEPDCRKHPQTSIVGRGKLTNSLESLQNQR